MPLHLLVFLKIFQRWFIVCLVEVFCFLGLSLFLTLIPKYYLFNTMVNRIVNFLFRLFIVTETQLTFVYGSVYSFAIFVQKFLCGILRVFYIKGHVICEQIILLTFHFHISSEFKFFIQKFLLSHVLFTTSLWS